MVMKINPVSGELDLTGGTGGAVNVTTVQADVGSANPTAGGVLNLLGGTGLSTTASPNTITVDLDIPVLVANGGTGQTSYINGEILIGNTTGNTLTKATITAGTGISVTNGNGSITIDATATGFTWQEVTAASDNLVAENGYIANRGTLVTLTLPAAADLGDTFEIIGKGAGLFRIAQNAGQSINFTASTTTVGVGGSLTAIDQFSALEIVCTTANTGFTVLTSQGNFTIV